MRKLILLCMILALSHAKIYAQFTSGNHFFILKGTTVSIDGLALTPLPGDLLMTKKAIIMSPDAIAMPGNSISRVYAFNEPFNFSGKARISYQLLELNGNLSQKLQIAYQEPGAQYVVTTGSTVGAGQYWVSQMFDSKGLTKITAINTGNALPVTLIYFSGKQVEENAILSWKTTSEINSDYFQIEQSVDGKSWQSLGIVNATHNSRSVVSYEYIDQNPANASNLYRLKMVDLDQSFSYSGIVNISFAGGSCINVYPNPAADRLLIRNEDWSNVKSIGVFDTSGYQVRIKKQGSTADPMVKELDLQGVFPGNYVLKIFTKDEGMKCFTFFKQ